jgi:hypothetical protein
MKNALLVAGVFVGVVAVALVIWATTGTGGGGRRHAAFVHSSNAGGWALFTPTGESLGRLVAVDCGTAVGEVSLETPFEGNDPKSVGAPGYEDCAATLTWGMSAEFWTWVNAAFHGSTDRRNLWLVHWDETGVERDRLELTDALLAGFALPALDANGTQSVKPDVTFRASQIRRVDGATGFSPQQSVGPTLTQSNFSLDAYGQSVLGALNVGEWTARVEPSGRPRLGDLAVTIGVNNQQSIDLFDSNLTRWLSGRYRNGSGAAVVSLRDGTNTVRARLSFGGVGLFGGDLVTRTAPTRHRDYKLYVQTADLQLLP